MPEQYRFDRYTVNTPKSLWPPSSVEPLRTTQALWEINNLVRNTPFAAYVAGGAVRDIVFTATVPSWGHYDPNDIDIYIVPTARCRRTRSEDELVEEASDLIVKLNTQLKSYGKTGAEIKQAYDFANRPNSPKPLYISRVASDKIAPIIPIDMILYSYTTIREIVSDFDIDTSMCYMTLEEYLTASKYTKENSHRYAGAKTSIWIANQHEILAHAFNASEMKCSLMFAIRKGWNLDGDTTRVAIMSLDSPWATIRRILDLHRKTQCSAFFLTETSMLMLAHQPSIDDEVAKHILKRTKAPCKDRVYGGNITIAEQGKKVKAPKKRLLARLKDIDDIPF